MSELGQSMTRLLESHQAPLLRRINTLEATVAKQSKQIAALLKMIEHTVDVFNDLEVTTHSGLKLMLYCNPEQITQALHELEFGN